MRTAIRRAALVLGACVVLATGASVFAAPCEYYFTWSCSGCAKIGGRTTGREGPFPTQGSCESAASSMRSNMGRAGGGVTVNSCSPTYYTCGNDIPARSSGPARGRTAPSPDYSAPAYDYEAEQRAQEERDRQERAAEEDRKRREQEVREKFEQDKRAALNQMKGAQSGALELKSGNIKMGAGIVNPAGDLKLKSAAGSGGASSAEKAFACAAWISNHAFPAARKGDVGEVRYLGEQVGRALKGETPGVECPGNLEPVPEIRNAGPLGPGGDLYRFYDHLLNATVAEAQKIEVSQRKLDALGLGHLTPADIPKLKQQIEASREPASPPTKPAEPQARPAAPPKQAAAPQKNAGEEKHKVEQEKKRRALEEAKKALEEAKRAASGIDDLERKGKQVSKRPSLAGAMTQRISD